MENKTLVILTALLAVSSAFLMVPLMMTEDSEAAPEIGVQPDSGSGTAEDPYVYNLFGYQNVVIIADQYHTVYNVSIGTDVQIRGGAKWTAPPTYIAYFYTGENGNEVQNVPDSDFEYELTHGDVATMDLPTRYNITVDKVGRFYTGVLYRSTDQSNVFAGISVYGVNPNRNVVFDEAGGSSVEDIVVSFGTEIVLPSTSKHGYVFDGWYDAATGGSRIGGAGDSYVVSEDKALYAHWSVDPVEITSGIPSGDRLYPLVGTSWSYTVTSDPSDVEVIVTGADWLSVKGKEIIGTPTSADADTKFTVTVTVTNGVSSDSQTFSLTVKPVLNFESKPTGWIEVVPS